MPFPLSTPQWPNPMRSRHLRLNQPMLMQQVGTPSLLLPTTLMTTLQSIIRQVIPAATERQIEVATKIIASIAAVAAIWTHERKP